MSQGSLRPAEAGRGRGGLSPRASGGSTAVLINALVLDFWLPELRENKYSSFHTTKFVVIHWGCHKKPNQVPVSGRGGHSGGEWEGLSLSRWEHRARSQGMWAASRRWNPMTAVLWIGHRPFKKTNCTMLCFLREFQGSFMVWFSTGLTPTPQFLPGWALCIAMQIDTTSTSFAHALPCAVPCLVPGTE